MQTAISIALVIGAALVIVAFISLPKVWRHRPELKRAIILDALGGRERRYGIELSTITNYRSRALYAVLDDLEREGLVTSTMMEGDSHVRRYYQITPAGRRVLESAQTDYLLSRSPSSQSSAER